MQTGSIMTVDDGELRISQRRVAMLTNVLIEIATERCKNPAALASETLEHVRYLDAPNKLHPPI
jgi:hypothetical protein